MANSKQETPEERRIRVAAELAEVAIDDAYAIAEEHSALIARRKANREQLRSLDAQGMLTAEQSAEVAELYPVRATKTENDGEGSGEDSSETPAAEPAAA